MLFCSSSVSFLLANDFPLSPGSCPHLFWQSPALSSVCILISHFVLILSHYMCKPCFLSSSPLLCSLISPRCACPDTVSEVAGSIVGSQDSWVAQKLGAQTKGGGWTEFSWSKCISWKYIFYIIEIQLISVFFCVTVGAMDSRGGRSRNVDLNMSGDCDGTFLVKVLA